MLSILPQNMNAALKAVSLREKSHTHTHTNDILKSSTVMRSRSMAEKKSM